MKDFDNIEDVFSSAFKDEAVTPPASVKQSIDKSLFGSKGLRLIYIIPLALLLLIGGSVWLMSGDETNTNGSKIQTSELKDNSAIISADSNVRTTSGKSGVSNSESFDASNDNTDASSSIRSNKATKDEKERVVKANRIKKGKDEKTVKEKDDMTTFLRMKKEKEERERLKALKEEEDLKKALALEEAKKKELQLEKERIERENRMKAKAEMSNLAMRAPHSFNFQNKWIELPYEEMVIDDEEVDDETKWEVAMYAGLNDAYNSAKIAKDIPTSDFQIAESKGRSFSIEAYRKIKSNSRVGLGFEYSSRSESFTEFDIGVIDSVITNSYWVWDSITQDSTQINTYDYFSTGIDDSIAFSTTRFSVPIYFRQTFSLGNSTEFGLTGGVKLSGIKQQLVYSDPAIANPPVQKAFGMSVMLRPEFRYSFKKAFIGVYGQAGWNVMNGTTWYGQRRTRLSYGAGIMIGYRF